MARLSRDAVNSQPEEQVDSEDLRCSDSGRGGELEGAPRWATARTAALGPGIGYRWGSGKDHLLVARCCRLTAR